MAEMARNVNDDLKHFYKRFGMAILRGIERNISRSTGNKALKRDTIRHFTLLILPCYRPRTTEIYLSSPCIDRKPS